MRVSCFLSQCLGCKCKCQIAKLWQGWQFLISCWSSQHVRLLKSQCPKLHQELSLSLHFTFYLWLVWHLCCPVLWRIRGRSRKVQGVTTQRKLSLKHWQYLCNGYVLYIHLTCVIVLFYCVALYAVQCTEKQVCCRWKRSCRTDALVLFSHWEAFWKHNWNWVKKPAEKATDY